MASIVQKGLARLTVAAATAAPVLASPAEASSITAATNNTDHVRGLDANPSFPPFSRADLKRLITNPGPAELHCSFLPVIPSPLLLAPSGIEAAGPPKAFQTHKAAGLDPDPSVTYNHNIAGAVSPDGKTIAATVWKIGVQGIDVGTKAAAVIYKYENPRERVQQLKWSPDGSKVAFVVFEPKSDPDAFEKCRLIVRDRAGKDLVDQPIAGFGQVTWTKDGKGVVTALSEPIPKSDPPAAQVRCFGMEVATGTKTWEWSTPSGKNPSSVRAVILTENDTRVAVAHVDVTQNSHKLTTVDVKAGTAKTSSLPPRHMDADSDRTPQSGLGVPGADLVEFNGGRVIYYPESSHGRGFDIQSNVNSPFAAFSGRQGVARSPDGTMMATFRRDETFGPKGQVWVFGTKDGLATTLPLEVNVKGRVLGISWTGKDSFALLLATTSQETSESLQLIPFNLKPWP